VAHFWKEKNACFISNSAMKLNGQKFPDFLGSKFSTILKGEYQVCVIFKQGGPY